MTSSKKTYLLLFFLLFTLTLAAQPPRRGYTRSYAVDEKGDTISVINLDPIYIFNKSYFKSERDFHKHRRLIYNLIKVYPIAKEANARLRAMEQEVEKLKTERQREQYVKKMEADLKKEYTPILKKMTISQGRILIKLIDRETGRTSYQLLKDIRGSFSAFFWQNIARIFGSNLKDHYDAKGEDKLIEELIILYETGMLPMEYYYY